MHEIVELSEQVDEVNYFLKEWLRLSSSKDIRAKAIKKPEIYFVSHGLERVIREATDLNVKLELKVGSTPVVARQNRKDVLAAKKPTRNILIPSNSTILVTDYHKLTSRSGKRFTFIGNKHGLFSVRTLAHTLANGGELRLAGAENVWA